MKFSVKFLLKVNRISSLILITVFTFLIVYFVLIDGEKVLAFIEEEQIKQIKGVLPENLKDKDDDLAEESEGNEKLHIILFAISNVIVSKKTNYIKIIINLSFAVSNIIYKLYWY